MSNPPQGLGRPPSGAPEMWSPVEPRPEPVHPPPTPPPDDEPPPGEQPPNNRRGWALLGGLGGVAVIGLVVGLFVIGDDQPGPGSPRAGGSDVAIECEPSDPPDGKKLSAEQFYEDKVWTKSGDGSVTAERTGRWNYAKCCDLGLGTAQADLNELGCSYGIEAAYESADGHMGIAQLILVFGDMGSAITAREEIEFTSFRLHPESGIYDDEMELYGYIEPNGDFLTYTIGAIDTDDSEIVSEAQKTLKAFHEEYTSTLPY